MALTYEKVIDVISKEPSRRQEFQVNNLLPWFKKKSELFSKLKTELLVDIIKNLQFVTQEKDDIIIKQGDRGDCMYILLRGKVTIYILYASKAEGDDDKSGQPVITARGGDALRKELGTFVCPLGPGATFGEVALMKEDDCIRTASIVADETCDLIVVDRSLYNRSVKNVLKKEFEDKQNFIATNKYFQTWAPKYKKQLAMALQTDYVPYEGQLTRQGEPVIAIYFILSGEIKMIMDPVQHKTQYTKHWPPDDVIPNGDTLTPDDDAVDNLLRCGSPKIRERTSSGEGVLPSRFRKKATKKQAQEVCLLGENQIIGDIEVLMEMDTYMQTAQSTQRTEVLVLEMKHYERLLAKRNPKTIHNMKMELAFRLNVLGHGQHRQMALLKTLQTKAEEYDLQQQQQSEARQAGQKERTRPRKTMTESFDSFVPPRGALIDQHGPGTVFYRIRERHRAKQMKQHRRKMFGGYNNAMGGANNAGPGGRAADSAPTQGALRLGRPTQGADEHVTSDPVLANLENRMRAWLENDTMGRGGARVAPLHRVSPESDDRKPGGLRGTNGEETPPDELEDGELHTGHAWV